MDSKAIAAAAALLVEARRSGVLLAALPPALRPATVGEAHAVQEAATRRLAETVGGWKANAPPGEEPQWAVLFERLIFPSPARIPAKSFPLRGVEAEIAFRFTADLQPREAAYGREEVAAAVVAFPAIEVVDSRFADFMQATPLERLADHGANGAFVAGAPFAGWRALALSKLRVTLAFGDKTVVDQVGGHPIGDPLEPAVALVNEMRKAGGVRRGQLVTTGSCTGMNIADAGDSVVARFEGLGAAEVTFTR